MSMYIRLNSLSQILKWISDNLCKNIKFGILVSKSIIILFTECIHKLKIQILKFKSYNFKKKTSLAIKGNI